jgi:hypothetical protein
LKKNIGSKDRLIRLFIALLLLAYAYWQMSWIALGVSLFTFGEALFSWCILYQLIGKNSCPVKKR